VLVRGDEVIGEGWHEGPGSPHAEAVALEAAEASGATMYVTLEPCDHHGHTAPCTEALIAAGVARVVVGLIDPDPRVSGGGVARLRGAGISVDDGVLADEVATSLAPYIKQRTTGRAFLTLKLAVSLDGHIAAADGTSRWITGPETRAYVHARRVEVDAVLVGAGTVMADDPSLTARSGDAPRQPVRIVADAAGRVPADMAVFRGTETIAPTRLTAGGFGRARQASAIVATTERAAHDRTIGWKGVGAEVLVLPQRAGGVDIGALLATLGERGFTEVLCEGGAELATSLLRDDLVDRLELHTGGVLLGTGPRIGDLGISTIERAPRWRRVSTWASGNDSLSVYEPVRA
jgi:diaminohydroxyphosphoribosylaminopyrimidine deaminase / 5-amino-6-(5-phosphoribosylamino)uracil reductase